MAHGQGPRLSTAQMHPLLSSSGSEPCIAAQAGSLRYNPTANYFELCSYRSLPRTNLMQ
jgi:hypothetical protein